MIDQKPTNGKQMTIIPNANPALVALSVWVNEDDHNDFLVSEIPIVGWHIDHAGIIADDDVLKIDRPFCIGEADDDWGILDNATGRVWNPSGFEFQTKAIAIEHLVKNARMRRRLFRDRDTTKASAAIAAEPSKD